MAITTAKITGYLDQVDLKYTLKDEDTVIVHFEDDDNKVVIVIRLQEEGEFMQIRTLKHLDELVEEAPADKRADLLSWMLKQNYSKKIGSWEYDPDDHDHHIAIGHPIEDGDVTFKQFMRMLAVVTQSASLIPEMKAVLGIVEDVIDPVEQKRQELLAQLRALEEGTGI